MLVLSRKTGQMIVLLRAGVVLARLKMVKVNSSECVFKVTPYGPDGALQPWELTVRRTESYRLRPDFELTVVAISRGIAKLGFEAPKEINIVRSELIETAQ